MTEHFTTEYCTTLETPIGELLLTSNGTALTGLFTHGHKLSAARNGDHGRTDKVLAAAREELIAYCEGTLQTFNVPLAPQGTAFQQRVWRALLDIPFGETESYGQLARRIGAPNAARAVGMANGRNPIAIIIPCHRVIGTSGALVGYGGGLPRKRWLLDHEVRCLASEQERSPVAAAVV
jgi:methylated-DNA-[protein]-cysteine S-methyltransferase